MSKSSMVSANIVKVMQGEKPVDGGTELMWPVMIHIVLTSRGATEFEYQRDALAIHKTMKENLPDGTMKALERLFTGKELLTRKEVATLELLAEGKTLSEIAETQGNVYGTVRNRAVNIRDKLNVSTNAEAVVVAMNLGWIE